MKYFIPSLYRLVNTGMKPIWSLPHKQREAKDILFPCSLCHICDQSFRFFYSFISIRSLFVPKRMPAKKQHIWRFTEITPTQPGNLPKNHSFRLEFFFTNTQRAPTVVTLPRTSYCGGRRRKTNHVTRSDA
jgi:hypothetical protein